MRFTHSRDERLPKITTAVSTDTSKRPEILSVYFDRDLGELHATNSYIAVRAPVEPEKGDVTGFLNPMDVAAAVKGKYPNLEGPKKGRERGGTFPDLVNLWPKAKQVENGFRVSFSAEQLRKAFDALGGGVGANKAIEFIFPAFGEPMAPHALRPILLRGGQPVRDKTPKDGVDQAEVLVMPIRINANQVPVGEPGDMTNQTNQTKEVTAVPKSTKTKTAIPYENVPDSKLTAGQKAARTKALKAAGKAPKAKGKDLGKTLRKQVDKAKKQPAKKQPAKSARSRGVGKGGSVALGLTAKQLTDRARKAAETRRRNLAAAA